MTEKRFYLMNVEDPLHEYGRWCKPVLEDGETGKQYEGALEVMDLLNALHEENQQLHQSIFELRTELALQRTKKEEHSDSVYDFQKKLEKW